MRDYKTSDGKEPWFYSIILDLVLVMALIFLISDCYLAVDYAALHLFKDEYYERHNIHVTNETLDDVETTSIMCGQ